MCLLQKTTCTRPENVNTSVSSWNTPTRIAKVVTCSSSTSGESVLEHRCVGSSFLDVFARTSGCSGSQHNALQPSPTLQCPAPCSCWSQLGHFTTCSCCDTAAQLQKNDQGTADMCEDINPTHTPGCIMLKSRGKRPSMIRFWRLSTQNPNFIKIL